MRGGAVADSPTDPSPSPQPSLRARWARRPPPFEFWIGSVLLGTYLMVGLSALVVFRNSLAVLPKNQAWVPPFSPIGPSWAHPFGVMPGFGTDLFRAIWQATPWDLAIVAGILFVDVSLGLLLGATAGFYEGGVVDAVVTFVGDSLGSVPPYLLLIVVFVGLGAGAPGAVGLPAFVLLFGLILWPTMARTVRERARILTHEGFVEASRASGATPRRVLVRHIVPNSLGPVLAQLPIDIAPIFFVLSVLPWFADCQNTYIANPLRPYIVPALPVGSPLPSVSFPEWGFLLGFGTCEGLGFPVGPTYWWMYLLPLLAILGLGFAVAFVCDGIERWRRLER
ncbi:MAG: ABC transporter permease [Thermoplasmata archaeon]